MSAIPNEELGLVFAPAEFTRLLRWHLGIAQVGSSNVSTNQCEYCGEISDIFGDHAVCCKRNKLWGRHQEVVTSLARIATASGATVQREISIPGGQRPADLLLSFCDGSAPIAVARWYILLSRRMAPMWPQLPAASLMLSDGST